MVRHGIYGESPRGLLPEAYYSVKALFMGNAQTLTVPRRTSETKNHLSLFRPLLRIQKGTRVILEVEPLLMFSAYFEGGLKGVRCREAFLAIF